MSAGTGGAIVVEGSAGVGKTKLIDASMQLATDLGFRAGRGVLEPYRTGPTELEALFDALFEGPSPLADRRALDDSHASPEFMFWLIQDLQSVIEEAALQSPILICLDDLHWAGASCAVAIRQLGPRLASLPVAWILAFRPNQGLAPVQEAKSDLIDGGAAHINLGPLKREAVALVAADVLGAQPDDDLLQRTERMKGNPFLLVEFLRGLQDDSVLKYDSGRAILVGDGQPGNQSEGIRGRLARLSPARRPRCHIRVEPGPPLHTSRPRRHDVFVGGRARRPGDRTSCGGRLHRGRGSPDLPARPHPRSGACRLGRSRSDGDSIAKVPTC